MAKKKVPGIPFVKGDPRINRKGRPKNSDKLKALLLQIAHEPAIDPESGKPYVINGKIVTKIEAMMRQMVSKDPKLFLEYTYGKPKTEIDITADINQTMVVLDEEG